MPFCPYCQSKIPENAIYCISCGKKVTISHIISDKNSSHDTFVMGNLKAKSNDHAAAINLYDQALQLDPDNYKIWYNKGIVLKRMGDIEKAKYCLNHAEELKNYDLKLQDANEPDSESFTNQPHRVNKIEIPPYSANIFCYYYAPLIAAVFFVLGFPGIFISSLFLGFCAYIDSSKLTKGYNNTSKHPNTWKPWHWGLLVVFTWLVGYLFYLYKRRELYEMRNNLNRTSHNLNNAFLVGVILFIAIGFSIIGLQVNSGSFGSSSSQYPTPSSQVPTQTQEQQFDFAHQEVTPETIKLALISMPRSSPGFGPGYSFGFNGTAMISDIQIFNLNSGKKSIHITYYVDSIWNSWHYLTGSATTATAIFYNLFKNTDIEEITVTSTTKFMDKYGKETVEPGLSAKMTRSTAEKIDWDNLMTMIYGNYRTFFPAVDSYEIDPGLEGSTCDGLFCS
jgi:hypothetical protein